MIICQVYETSRTLHIWDPPEAPGCSNIYLSPSFTNYLSTYLKLSYTAFHWPSFYCRKPGGLHCSCGWLLQNVVYNSMTSTLLMTFPSAFTQPSAPMVIAWNSLSLKTAHLQNLFIQSFPYLVTTSSPWWFSSYYHNCSLTTSEPPVHWLIDTIPFHQLSLVCTSFIIQHWILGPSF